VDDGGYHYDSPFVGAVSDLAIRAKVWNLADKFLSAGIFGWLDRIQTGYLFGLCDFRVQCLDSA
jgi:hypothetical protein